MNCVLELVEKRKLIVNELVELRDSVSPFIDLFEREDVKKLLETDRLKINKQLIKQLDIKLDNYVLFLEIILLYWTIYAIIIQRQGF